MCGINGYYSCSPLTQEDKNKIVAMNKSMHYRGPDEQDFWMGEHAIFAQARLSIIGVSNGKQPICSEDSNYILICNGEIYNYKELKLKLQEQGHIFSTESDCEVLLHLYEEKKKPCSTIYAACMLLPFMM